MVAATLLDEDQIPFGVVNIRALDIAPSLMPLPTPIDFDMESASAREERRRNNWTPVIIKIDTK